MSVRREILLIFGCLAEALTIATLIGFILQLGVRDAKAKLALDNLTARVRAWWVMVMILGAALFAGRGAVILLFAVVSLAALREFITLTHTRRADHGALRLSFFVVAPIQ